MMELTKSGKALIITLLFRLLFGGYLIGMDQYRFNDVGSALQVLLIYGSIGLLGTLFILGAKYVLFGLIGLDILFLAAQAAYLILSLSHIVDPGLHDPSTNWGALLLMFIFSLLTIIFALRAKKETRLSLGRITSLEKGAFK